ncbi:MAG TPA: hypothetical protein VEO54_21945 [Thermoanaerobaculia bacterium]|nr:hypothetical protein [Thermoanaerobaculia bacterium]
MIRTATILVAFLTAATALAQRPLFDPDDFLDPRETGGRPAFVSRVIIGGASNMSGDGFRPLGKQTGYVHLSNSFYWRSLQFDYKRSETRAVDGEAAQWQRQERTPVRNATPESKDTLNAAWYWPVPTGGGIPVMLRSRVTFTRQSTENELLTAGAPMQWSVRERTVALDTDTWFRIGRHDVFGSLAVSETKATGAPNGLPGNRKERALTYTNRFPSFSYDRARIMIRPTLTVGGISNRGGSAVNLVNPAIEIFRPFIRTGANLHVIYSPQWAVDANDRWQTTHQVAVYVDRALFVKVFGATPAR